MYPSVFDILIISINKLHFTKFEAVPGRARPSPEIFDPGLQCNFESQEIPPDILASRYVVSRTTFFRFSCFLQIFKFLKFPGPNKLSMTSCYN